MDIRAILGAFLTSAQAPGITRGCISGVRRDVWMPTATCHETTWLYNPPPYNSCLSILNLRLQSRIDILLMPGATASSAEGWGCPMKEYFHTRPMLWRGDNCILYSPLSTVSHNYNAKLLPAFHHALTFWILNGKVLNAFESLYAKLKTPPSPPHKKERCVHSSDYSV